MKRINAFILCFAFFFLAACGGKKEHSYDNWVWAEEEKPNEEITAAGWTDVSSTYGELPAGLRIYKSPDNLAGKKAIAYIAVAELAKIDFGVWSIKDPKLSGSEDAFRTPANVYGEGAQPVIINGGYFYSASGKNYSASLAVNAGELYSPNINYTSADWVKIYYPTRGALLRHSDGSIEACWTYFSATAGHFMYDRPAPNSWSGEPLQVPSATFPEGGKPFEAVTGIGGGPVLVKNGVKKNTVAEEMFNGSSGIMPEGNHPRTAIGVTGDGRMILFVCEGRQKTEGVAGLSTGDVADVMLALGCKEAINLDGGGSSCMLVNGKETIKPSDGKQRAVGSTVMLTAKPAKS